MSLGRLAIIVVIVVFGLLILVNFVAFNACSTTSSELIPPVAPTSSLG